MAYVPRPKRSPYRMGKKPGPTAARHRTFCPDNEQMVRMIAAKGASDEELEDMFMLEAGTIADWRKRYPRFEKALVEGRSKPDADVLFALYRNAVGYEYEEDQAVGGKEPAVLTVRKHARPSVDAEKYWLSQRKQDDWRPVQRNELSGMNGGAIGIKTETRSELIDAILALIHPQPDPEPPKPVQDSRQR